ncbi:MAG: translation initiation factor IF-2 N-terminal domain-containing protein, partial [Desulfitobacteriaceae bacterium]|nr:translation initiation factor IF-2 N-terminal domain-containing protein [Desulfitobacteriaceae bacterium]MDI6881069.1 translation initiation factor IF-2 N-terminal domain-containing protein [Desulfitobacteriaceae bacterium]
MTIIRVHELAKELSVSSKDVMTRLEAIGVDVKNHLSKVEPADAARLRAEMGFPNKDKDKDNDNKRPEPHSSAPQTMKPSEGQSPDVGNENHMQRSEGDLGQLGGERPSRPAGYPPRPGMENRPPRPAGERPPRPGMENRPPRPAGERPPRPAGERPPRPAGYPPRPGMENRPPRPEGYPPRPGMENRPLRPAGERPP